MAVLDNIRPVLRYCGSKFQLRRQIIEVLDSVRHRSFVEGFGGSGIIIASKTPAKIEYYNDIDGNLTAFFRVIQNTYTFSELIGRLRFFVYDETIFHEQLKVLQEKTYSTDVDRAFAFFCVSVMSYSGCLECFSICTTYNCAKSTQNKIEKLYAWHNRFKNVFITEKPWRDIIAKTDSKDTLFYFDPPYVWGARSKQQYYTVEMINKEHEEFVDILLKIRGKAVVSGYYNEIYNRLLENNWTTKEFSVKTSLGNLSEGNIDYSRTEVLFISPNCMIKEKQIS